MCHHHCALITDVNGCLNLENWFVLPNGHKNVEERILKRAVLVRFCRRIDDFTAWPCRTRVAVPRPRMWVAAVTAAVLKWRCDKAEVGSASPSSSALSPSFYWQHCHRCWTHSSRRRCDPPAYERYAPADRCGSNGFHDCTCRRSSINRRTTAILAVRKTRVSPSQAPASAKIKINRLWNKTRRQRKNKKSQNGGSFLQYTLIKILR